MKQDQSFSSTYYSSVGFQQKVSRPISSHNKCNFLLKDNMFQRDRSISYKNPKSAFSDVIQNVTNNSVESLKKPDQLSKNLIKMGFLGKKKSEEKSSDEESQSRSSSDSQGGDTEEKNEQLPKENLKNLILHNVKNPDLLSSQVLQDTPINAISLSSDIFLVTCQKSNQLKSFKMEKNNNINLRAVFNCNNLLLMQKSLVSGLFYLYGSIKMNKGENVNVVKLYQLSEQGLPIEIIEMRDINREEIEHLFPFDEYTQLFNQKGQNFNPYDHVSVSNAVNTMQFAGVFQEIKGFRTIKLWEMQLKSGNIKKSQISCINTFQIETGNEKIGWANLPKKKQFIIFTSSVIYKISYLKSQKDGQDYYQQFIQKRVFKFVNFKQNRGERDRLISCCLTGYQDMILVCTKQATFYLLDFKNLDVISMVDYCGKCGITRSIDIILCSCPYITDECDANLPNLVRLTTQTSKFQNKIYMYDVIQQRNIMESPIIQNPILFCFYLKGSIGFDLKNQLNNLTCMIIEENYEYDKEINQKSLINQFMSPKINKQPQKTEIVLLNFYKPLKEIPRQLIQSASSYLKSNTLQNSEFQLNE